MEKSRSQNTGIIWETKPHTSRIPLLTSFTVIQTYKINKTEELI